MAANARDLQKAATDTTDVGFDLVLDAVDSPAGDVGITRICVGTGTTLTRMDASNPLFAQLTAGTAAIGKLAANSGVDIGDVDILSIAAGDNNIGNVDIVTLPAGNLGQQAMAASLSVVPASDITDATYIGDIKFGESLPAGTAAIGKLAANSGVDIGDVTINGPLGGGVESGALLVTIASDSTGVLSIDDNDGSITVDGTFWQTTQPVSLASVPSHAVTNAGTFAVQAALDAETTKVIGTVNIAAAQTVAVTNAGTFATQVDGAALTALQLIDDPVATIGTTPLQRVAIFDASDSQITSFGGGTEYTEDVATPNPIVGTASLMERDDVISTLTPVEGDWVGMRSTSEGALWVQDFNSDTHLSTLTSVMTAVQLIDDAVSGAGFNITQFGGAAVPIGAGLEATAVRVTLPTDGTGVVGLAAGTAAIGKLAANSGVDIGDVDVLTCGTITPGTGATNLGKEIDNPVGGTDTGVALLACHTEDQTNLTTADGDYDVARMNSLGQLSASIEAHHIFDELDVTTDWTALGNDTLNIATTSVHALGVAALTFDKVNGAANTAIAGIQKTLSSTDLGTVSPHDIIMSMVYLPTITDVSYIFLRLGTDSSNYTEWRIDVTQLTAAEFETLGFIVGDISAAGNTGTGWVQTAITYVAVGVAFNAETDTLAGIIFDQISYHTNTHTSASIQSEVTSSVSSSNVNIQKVGNKVVDTQNGSVSTGTQRVTIADDSTGILAGVTTVTTVTTCATVTTLTGGGIAHDSVDSGNPIKIGAKATASQLGETPVAANDRSNLFTGTDGALLTRDGSLEDCISERITNTNGTSTDMTGSFAATASQRIYLTDITISNSSATFCTVDIRDGAAGSVLWTFPVPATSGVTHAFKRPLRFTANTALAYDVSAAISTISCSVSGFKSKA